MIQFSIFALHALNTLRLRVHVGLADVKDCVRLGHVNQPLQGLADVVHDTLVLGLVVRGQPGPDNE